MRARRVPLEHVGLWLASIAWTAVAVAADTAPAGAPGTTTDRVVTVDDFKGLAWRSVGPANMGGRASAIALIPGSRTSFYVGFGTGGVFKTDNLGVTFKPVFDATGIASIGAIAVADAPANWRGWAAEDKDRKTEDAAAAADTKKAKRDAHKPKDTAKSADDDRTERGKGKIVWVGTGEGNNRNSSSWGHGVYRSTDAGATFKSVGLEETRDIPHLAVDPRDPDVCYVAALGHLWGANPERGVFKTTDGGATWQHVLKVDAETGACDVVLDPASPNTVYAALYARRRTPWSYTGNSDKGGIFRSDDAGRTWKKLTQGLPPRTGRIGLAVYAKDPRILYAEVESDFGGTGRDPFDDRSPNGGLFRSEDRGATWVRASEFNFRPFYFSRLAIDPDNDQRVYLPGWDLGISDDGGKTVRRSGSENVHVDMHAIIVNPADPNQILIGCDGGVYISHDRAATWDFLDHMAVGEFYRIAVDNSDPYRIAGGLQDNGSWVGPSETLSQTMDEAKDGILSSDWRMVFGSDGFTVAFDPADANRMYATGQGGYLGRLRLDDNVQRFLRPTPREGQERLRFNWNAPFLISRHDPSVLYHAGNRVYKLTERGDHWFAISPDLTRNEADKTATVGSDAETYGTVVSLAESPLAKGHLWTGSDDGRVQVTTDEGKNWKDVTPAAVNGMYVSRIAASGLDARTAYVAVNGHRSDVLTPIVLMTQDDGATWSNIAGDLPADEPVESVTEDLGNRDVLYCGTEHACFVTLDRGAHWLNLNGKSLPPAAVHDIAIQPRERDLVVGTHGRSIWVLDNAGFLGQLAAVRNQKIAVFDVLPAVPRLYAGRAYGAGHGLFRAKNGPMGAIFDVWVRDAAGEALSVSIADSTGFTVRELTATTRKGVNRVVWDLQMDRKHLFTSVDENELGQTQFVRAGTYKATVSVGEDKVEKAFRVLPAPDPKH